MTRRSGELEPHARDGWRGKKELSPGRDAGERFTALQGQYLAFIRTYTLIHREAPAEADMRRFFRVTPPSVHAMVLTLEKRGLIERVPGKARSIRLLVSTGELPQLEERSNERA